MAQFLTWDQMVERHWRRLMASQGQPVTGKYTPSTNEMARTLDNYGWDK